MVADVPSGLILTPPQETKKRRGTTTFSVLKVPRQWPIVLLVEVCLREGKAVRSENGKRSECGLCYEQRREVEQGLYCVRLELILVLTLEVLH
jgi:hypothetical protein